MTEVRICALKRCEESCNPDYCLCDRHRLTRQFLLRDLERWWPDEEFSDNDIFFMLDHLKGCTATELEIYLGPELVKPHRIAAALERGDFEALPHTWHTPWRAPLSTQAEIISVTKYYTPIVEVAKKWMPGHGQTAMNYLNDGVYGKTRKNITGLKCVKRNRIPFILEKTERMLATAYQRRIRNFRASIFGHNKLSSVEVGEMIGIGYKRVCTLISISELKAQKCRSCYVILLEDLIDFLRRVPTSKIHYWDRVRQNCQALLAELTTGSFKEAAG